MESSQIIQHSRARFDHAAARKLLQEKYEAKLIMSHNGGLWRAGPELISLLNACAASAEIVLLDLYNTPIKISTQELLSLCLQHWQEQMNAWLQEYNELSRER